MSGNLDRYKWMHRQHRTEDIKLLRTKIEKISQQIEDGEIELGRAMRFAIHAEQSTATLMLGLQKRYFQAIPLKQKIQNWKDQIRGLEVAIQYATKVASGEIEEDFDSYVSWLLNDWVFPDSY